MYLIKNLFMFTRAIVTVSIEFDRNIGLIVNKNDFQTESTRRFKGMYVPT